VRLPLILREVLESEVDVPAKEMGVYNTTIISAKEPDEIV